MTETSPTPSTGASFIPGAKPPETAPVPESRAAASQLTGSPTVAGKAETIPPARSNGDQLARIEDKCARIEDKYARSEALLSRMEEKVEGASQRMNESARQADVTALRSEVRAIADRTKRLPGAGALVLTAIITAVLTVVLMIAVQRLNLQAMIPV